MRTEILGRMRSESRFPARNTLPASRLFTFSAEVEDHGVGCPDNVRESLGSRVTRLLVRQLAAVALHRLARNDHHSIEEHLS